MCVASANAKAAESLRRRRRVFAAPTAAAAGAAPVAPPFEAFRVADHASTSFVYAIGMRSPDVAEGCAPRLAVFRPVEVVDGGSDCPLLPGLVVALQRRNAADSSGECPWVSTRTCKCHGSAMEAEADDGGAEAVVDAPSSEKCRCLRLCSLLLSELDLEAVSLDVWRDIEAANSVDGWRSMFGSIGSCVEAVYVPMKHLVVGIGGLLRGVYRATWHVCRGADISIAQSRAAPGARVFVRGAVSPAGIVEATLGSSSGDRTVRADGCPYVLNAHVNVTRCGHCSKLQRTLTARATRAYDDMEDTLRCEETKSLLPHKGMQDLADRTAAAMKRLQEYKV